ncbi:hypothetical protein CCR75_005790 [Bremia lactucae]|uniref:CCAAT-binding factor domain-containing protein n=1 Tax=Bremia lactucae TaxID=4779 RepID=A0A976IC79_BRELC|nr:hypothetical protein CCR75_005790 [Bremia lactucae]
MGKMVPDLEPSNLSQLVALLGEQGVAWYDAEPKLKPKLKYKEDHEPLKATDELVLTLKQQAQQLLEREVTRFETQKSGKMSSDDKYLATMMKSGTLADRVAALTLTTQASPLHSLLRLGQLIAMASKKSRRESLMAVDSLKDVFLNNLLPNEGKLRYFHHHPLRAAQTSPCHLVLWFFEHCLKTAYTQLTSVLAAGMDDAVDSHKRACLRAANALLKAKPEQEAVLLAMLVNKLGDPDRKIAAYLHRMLHELLREHPAMKRVVVDEVERLLTRSKVSDRAKYNAVLCLNQLYLDRTEGDILLANHLISVYFGLFATEVHRFEAKRQLGTKGAKKATNAKVAMSDEAMDRKLLSALLVGVNRAFPYADATSATVFKDIDALFQVVHRSHHSTSVQALMLLFQVMDRSNSVSDRFYTALYSKLLDSKVRETSKHTLFLNLLFRAMKADVSPARTCAFFKRLLQIASVMPPAFACGVLFLLSEVLKVKPHLRTLLDQPEATSMNEHVIEDEHFDDAKTETAEFESEDDNAIGNTDESTVDDGLTEAERSAKVLKNMFGNETEDMTASVAVHSSTNNKREEYDALKRNPLFAGAETACAWELQLLLRHYHPSVVSFARQLVDNKDTGIQYAGDPLVDFTMHAFFEKFVNKKPRRKDGKKSNDRIGAKAKNWTFAPINTEAVLQANEANVDASDQFFYKFFKERESRESERKKKRPAMGKNEHNGDALSDVEDEEELDGYAQELAEGMMKDGDFDDEDPDTTGWSDDSEEEEALEGEIETDVFEVEDPLTEDEDLDGNVGLSVVEADDDDAVLQEEWQGVEAKRKKQTPPKARGKRNAMFADADDYDQIVKDAKAQQAKGLKSKKGLMTKKMRRS